MGCLLLRTALFLIVMDNSVERNIISSVFRSMYVFECEMMNNTRLGDEADWFCTIYKTHVTDNSVGYSYGVCGRQVLSRTIISPKLRRCLYSGVLIATIFLRSKTIMSLYHTEDLFYKLCVSYTFLFFSPCNNKECLLEPFLQVLSFTYEGHIRWRADLKHYIPNWQQRKILESTQTWDDHGAVLCREMHMVWEAMMFWTLIHILHQVVLGSFGCRAVQSFTSVFLDVK